MDLEQRGRVLEDAEPDNRKHVDYSYTANRDLSAAVKVAAGSDPSWQPLR